MISTLNLTLLITSAEKHSTKKTKEHTKRNKANNSPSNTESRDVKPKTNKRKKIPVEILGDSMLNGVQEKGLNKNADINIKIRKYLGASSNDILDHIRPSLRKEPDQIIIHEGTNNLTNDHNYLNNEKKNCKKWSRRHVKASNSVYPHCFVEMT